MLHHLAGCKTLTSEGENVPTKGPMGAGFILPNKSDLQPLDGGARTLFCSSSSPQLFLGEAFASNTGCCGLCFFFLGTDRGHFGNISLADFPSCVKQASGNSYNVITAGRVFFSASRLSTGKGKGLGFQFAD